jgi:hypothetical protein
MYSPFTSGVFNVLQNISLQNGARIFGAAFQLVR